jgi:hypothetical protein
VTKLEVAMRHFYLRQRKSDGNWTSQRSTPPGMWRLWLSATPNGKKIISRFDFEAVIRAGGGEEERGILEREKMVFSNFTAIVRMDKEIAEKARAIYHKGKRDFLEKYFHGRMIDYEDFLMLIDAAEYSGGSENYLAYGVLGDKLATEKLQQLTRPPLRAPIPRLRLWGRCPQAPP